MKFDQDKRSFRDQHGIHGGISRHQAQIKSLVVGSNVSIISEHISSRYTILTFLVFIRFHWLYNYCYIAGLAWLIISQPWSFTFLDGTFVYNSWRIFLTICGTPALLAFLVMLYLPESPMFLMAQGRNDEALKVFQRMYATNTGNSPETFPVIYWSF